MTLKIKLGFILAFLLCSAAHTETIEELRVELQSNNPKRILAALKKVPAENGNLLFKDILEANLHREGKFVLESAKAINRFKNPQDAAAGLLQLMATEYFTLHLPGMPEAARLFLNYGNRATTLMERHILDKSHKDDVYKSAVFELLAETPTSKIDSYLDLIDKGLNSGNAQVIKSAIAAIEDFVERGVPKSKFTALYDTLIKILQNDKWLQGSYAKTKEAPYTFAAQCAYALKPSPELVSALQALVKKSNNKKIANEMRQSWISVINWHQGKKGNILDMTARARDQLELAFEDMPKLSFSPTLTKSRAEHVVTNLKYLDAGERKEYVDKFMKSNRDETRKFRMFLVQALDKDPDPAISGLINQNAKCFLYLQRLQELRRRRSGSED